MKLRQLEYVMWVARLGSFSQAAYKLRVAQPAISKQVQALEIELGARLFHRNGHGAVPTNAARILCSAAENIFGQIEEARDAISGLNDSPTGTVRLGVPPSLSQYFATHVDDFIRSQYPDITLKIIEGWTGYLYDWIASGRIDLGIIYSSQASEHLIWEPIVTEDLFVIGSGVVPPGQSEYSMADLAQLPLVVPTRPHGLRLVIDRAFAKQGLKPNIKLEVEVWSVLKDRVARGDVYTLMPPSEIREDINSGRLRATLIAAPKIKRTLCIARSKQNRLTRAMEKVFGAILNETFKGVSNGTGKSKLDCQANKKLRRDRTLGSVV